MSFMLDGLVVPSPSLGGPPSHQKNRLSISFNDFFGNFWDMNITRKDKFIWFYPAISVEDAKIIEDIINPKLDHMGFGVNSFDVTSWTLQGFITVKCYLGATIDYEVVASDNGMPTLVKLEYHWIKIKGVDVLGAITGL
jgi:hypothetical protein